MTKTWNAHLASEGVYVPLEFATREARLEYLDNVTPVRVARGVYANAERTIYTACDLDYLIPFLVKSVNNVALVGR